MNFREVTQPGRLERNIFLGQIEKHSISLVGGHLGDLR